MVRSRERNTSTRGWAGTGSTTRWRQLRLHVLVRDGYTCMIRGPRCTGLADSVDHVVPLYQGGSKYDPENCRAACIRCNAGRRSYGPEPARTTVVESRTCW